MSEFKYTPLLLINTNQGTNSAEPVKLPDWALEGLEAGFSLGMVALSAVLTIQIRKAKAKIEKMLKAQKTATLVDPQAEAQITHLLYSLKDRLECDSISLTLLHNGQTTQYGYHFIKTTTIQKISDAGLRHSKEPNKYYPLTFTVEDNLNKFFINRNFAPVTYTYILRINNIDIGYIDAQYYSLKESINDIPINELLQKISEALISNLTGLKYG